MPSVPDARTQDVYAAIAMGVALLFALGDLLILVLWAVARWKRLSFARYAGPADLFLGLQAVLGAVLFSVVACSLPLALAGRLDPGGAVESSPVFFYGVLLPAMLVQQAALIGVPVLLVRLKYRDSVASLGFAPIRWRQVAGGIALAVALVPVVDLLEALCRRWLFHPGWGPWADVFRSMTESADALALLHQARGNPAALAALCLLVGGLGPVAEEVFFRGFALRALRGPLGRRAALLVSAALFAVIHMNPVALLPIFLMGLVLGLLLERTGNLAASVAMHCTNNSLALLFFFAAPDFRLWDRVLPPGP